MLTPCYPMNRGGSNDGGVQNNHNFLLYDWKETDPIKKLQWLEFSSNSVTTVVKFNSKIHDVMEQRNSSDVLVVKCNEENYPVNLNKKLLYSLSCNNATGISTQQ